MGYFMTRVELHGGTAADYEKLHEAMRLQGFSRNVKSSDGVLYRLPTAQYRFESATLSLVQIREKASAAARSIGKEFAVLVTEGLSVWVGLERVKIATRPVKQDSPSLARLAKMTKRMP